MPFKQAHKKTSFYHAGPFMNLDKEKLLTWPPAVIFFAFICALLWGSAFPLVKQGFEILDIQHSTGGKLYFAAYRFFIAGLMIFAWIALSGKNVFLGTKKDYFPVFMVGLLQTTLQYVFFYIGLSNTTGVKASILMGSGSIFLMLFTHLWFKDDPITLKKTIGVVLGFTGIVLVSMKKGGLDFEFRFFGEGFLLLTAIFSTLAMVIVKKSSMRIYPPLMSAWNLVLGSVMLFVLALFFESPEILVFSKKAVWLLLYLSFLSAAAFSIWYILIKYNRLTRMAVYRFLIPICGAFLSAALIPGEALHWLNLVSLALVCMGMVLTTKN